MEKKSIIINVIFGLCIVALFILHFTDRNGSSAQPGVISADSTGAILKMPVAYVNIDSLLLNYKYSKDLNEVLLRKRENAQATLTQKARQLESEMAEFQKKHENNAFLSEQSFKSQQQHLVKKQQDLQALEDNLTKQLMADQQAMNEQLRDTIYSFLKKYNIDKKYQIIISNTMNDNIMIADPSYDITKEIVQLLNKNYVPKED
jgi:outer membrane protein